MQKIDRHDMPLQSANERICNFREVALGYSPTMAKEEAQRCLNCASAPCMKGCPVGVHIPDFIARVRANDLDGAAEILKKDNNLASICGRVCPQENQCEKYCVRREKMGGSVAIGNLERFVADHALDKQEGSCARQNCFDNEDANRYKAPNKRVAVVGSGPASLSCAADLARSGISVTIMEALHKAGGVLEYGIPEFRLPKSLVQKEIDNIKALGVEILTNVVVGKTVYVDELLLEYDAVFIGTGAGVPTFLHVKGENLNGVYSANEYLTRVNLMKAYDKNSDTPIIRGKNIVVVGAGNVAMDSARTALRLGGNVTLVYRRSRAEMPARAEEIIHAEEEGVKFELLVNPVEILGDEGSVVGIRCVRMELGEPDASGRRRPKAIAGSEFDIECDQVIVALGTTPNPIIKNSLPRLAVTDKNMICADENGRTNIKGVYTGGDAQTGAATVILAMGAGKRAAKAIIEDLRS